MNKKCFFIVLGCLLSCLLSSPLAASASDGSLGQSTSEKQYVLKESELNTLSNNLEKLKVINGRQQDTLGKQQEQIKKLNEKLSVAEKQLWKSNEALTKAEDTSRKVNDSLMTVNQSFEKFVNEERRTRLRIKRQRNMWEALCISSLFLFTYHKLN